MVAIIGILAAVAIPQYQNYVARAQVSEALVLMSGAKTGVAEYFSTNGTFPADNPTAGLSDPDDISGNYVESVTVSVADGKALITALFSSTDAHSKLQGKSMVLTAVDHGGSIGFACSGTDIESYLPSSCADVTGDPVVAGPTPWAERDRSDPDLTACWDGTLDEGAGGWVVGANYCVVGERIFCTKDDIRGLAESGFSAHAVSAGLVWAGDCVRDCEKDYTWEDCP